MFKEVILIRVWFIMNNIILFIVLVNKKLDTWTPLETEDKTEDTTMRGSA